MVDLSKYEKGEYADDGREWPRVDCYGLVLEVRRDMGLPQWPEWDKTRKDDGGMARVGREWLPSLRPSEPAPGAMVVCYSGSFVEHCGVIVDVGGMLEVLDIRFDGGVKCLPLSRFRRAFTRVEYYT